MGPTFYKILLDPSSSDLPLPSAFVSKHVENKIQSGPITISANGGYSWGLKMEHIGETYCFTNGWNNVVEDIQLGFGDFLFFQLVDKSAYKMSIYNPNGCEKILPQESEQTGGVDEDVVSEFETIVLEDDENDDHEMNEESGVDEDQEEDDDPFFTTIFTKFHTNMLRLPTGFVKLAGINVGEGTVKLKNLDGKEWAMGLKLDKSYKRKARKFKAYCLSSGWTNFHQANDLSEGDECVFKFIKSEKKLLLAKVIKKTDIENAN